MHACACVFSLGGKNFPLNWVSNEQIETIKENTCPSVTDTERSVYLADYYH